MKCSKSLILILLMLALTSSALAQLKNWSQLISFNGGYVLLDGEATDNTMNGYAFGITYEQVNMYGELSTGVLISYLAGHDEDSDNNRRINYQSIPILLQSKLFFGSEKIKGYLQVGIGIQFSRIEFTSEKLLLQDGDSGLVLGLGLGGLLFTDEKLFINLAYNLTLMTNSYYRNGIIHLFKLGIGFQSI